MTQLESTEPHLSATEFFTNFVSQRKPAIITGLPNDPSFAAQKWPSDLDYLSSKAGDTKVLVEPMHPTTQQFGTDVQRISMPFRDFLLSLKNDKGPYQYLTTQYSGEEWDALTVFSPPTGALRDEFPEVPRIMGNLYLQQANLWLGKSKDGTSSGLHHDFHDNLYCLLKGRKRFVLYPPQEHENLYPHGTVHTLHQNGVIAYDKMLRADGLDHRVALRTRVAVLKRQLDALEVSGAKSKGKGKAKAATKERKALEKEYLNLREELEELAEDEQYGFPLDDDEDGVERVEDGSDLGSLAGDLDGQDDYEALMGEDMLDGGSVMGDGQAGEASEDSENPEDPPSFSRIATAFLHKQLDLPTTAVAPSDSTPADFLNLAKASPPYVVELSAGQMLYLPASWWHEVTSSSDGEEDVHMALNWWFYPPDADSFEEPYADKVVWDHLRETGRKHEKELDSASNEGKRKREDGHESPAKKPKK
ncbi:cupin-like domain-containing protein [Fomitopsis serialis]|uniref:cupin-like domain-containing protein n=1 Tax=Fomitopsis serialis TaxID=139415 RepID=UPI0020084719|nr:cupin-like domain-containing protein [Neoantrodia serialis]KAH9922387.1 cupin-like domain-containing protein [Neoantrodia serialis]